MYYSKYCIETGDLATLSNYTLAFQDGFTKDSPEVLWGTCEW